MFGKRKIKAEHYDRENLRPVIRASICTGEQVAGFKNIHTGKFEDVMLIRDNRDIKEFLQRYDIEAEEVTKEY